MMWSHKDYRCCRLTVDPGLTPVSRARESNTQKTCASSHPKTETAQTLYQNREGLLFRLCAVENSRIDPSSRLATGPAAFPTKEITSKLKFQTPPDSIISKTVPAPPEPPADVVP